MVKSFLSFKSVEVFRKKKKCSLRGDVLRIIYDGLIDSLKILYLWILLYREW